MKKEKFKSLTYIEALKLKEEMQGVFLKNIPFNNANVYALNDSSFLILPLNPYSTSLLVYEKDYMEEMLKTNIFPVKEEMNSFYDSNKEKIDNLNVHVNELIAELEDYLRLSNSNFEKERLDVDSVYKLLKAKNTLETYKLNFLVFLAKFIKENYDQSVRIGLLRDKQTLIPIVSIVLVKQSDSDLTFFNLENEVFGRSDYWGIQSIVNDLTEFKRKTSLFYEISKVFDWPIRE